MIIVHKGQLISHLYLFVIIMLILSSCVPIQKEIQNSSPTFIPSMSTPTPTPQHSPAAARSYIHYVPPEGSNIYLEFDYPSSWLFNDETYGESLIVFDFTDPRFLTLPTPSTDEMHPVPTDFGEVVVLLAPLQPEQNSNSEVETRKQIYSETWWATFLNDYKITIDGYDARVLEYQIQVPEIHASLMFERRIFLVVENQLHQIIFSVAEKERGGEFEQGYEYFFNSLKIVP